MNTMLGSKKVKHFITIFNTFPAALLSLPGAVKGIWENTWHECGDGALISGQCIELPESKDHTAD